MFKVGDKVVCIDVKKYNNNNYNVNLIKYNIYTINIDFSVFDRSSFGRSRVEIKECCNETFYSERFILLKEYRKQKLKQIELCSTQEIK